MDFITTEWFGVTIIRPNNLITNVLVGVFGCVFCRLTLKMDKGQLTWLKWWAHFFLFVGLGTAIGGFAHAFNYDYPRVQHTFWDHIAWIIAGIGLYFSEKTRSVWHYKYGNYMIHFANVKLLLFTLLMVVLSFYQFSAINNFDIVRWNATISVLFLLTTTYFWVYRMRHIKSWIFFLSGFGILLVGVPVYNFKLRAHAWFDHHDIGHCLQIIAFGFFYLGILQEVLPVKMDIFKHSAE